MILGHNITKARPSAWKALKTETRGKITHSRTLPQEGQRIEQYAHSNSKLLHLSWDQAVINQWITIQVEHLPALGWTAASVPGVNCFFPHCLHVVTLVPLSSHNCSSHFRESFLQDGFNPWNFLLIIRAEVKLEHHNLRYQARMTLGAEKEKIVEECQDSQMYS